MAFFVPARATRFLNSFASSARAHYSEIVLRLIVGAALVVAAPGMLYSPTFLAFGWVLVTTSLVLLLLPRRWHQRFAQLVVPTVTRRVWLFGAVSLPLGGVTLFALLN